MKFLTEDSSSAGNGTEDFLLPQLEDRSTRSCVTCFESKVGDSLVRPFG